MKNNNAKNGDWLTIVVSIGFAILSDVLDKPLYRLVATAIMILLLIYVVIRGIIRTRFHIQTENPNIRTWFSIKVDYWLLFIRNLIIYGFFAAIFFISLYLSGQTMWLSLLGIVLVFIVLLMIITKFEKKTDIIDHEDD
ncbi:hypothetical protein [Staphylococcus caeli]|uniref:Uncharacterized protein n=1 Tax=Staphylococcus caeli TaxID=2201815 RepID=A0A1D4I848_9STAP|nr:hypothetical protein [Staphylococcus caeli]SCS19979.1 Uncharacterised protein [Staphylococcus caeli]SCS45583.1 Uncharacterised protein [Staphylococcus caeli]